MEPEDTAQGQQLKIRRYSRLFLTGLFAVGVLGVGYSLTSVRKVSAPYNAVPRGGDNVYNSTSLPVVLWHGMGDSCCASWSIGALQRQIEKSLPGSTLNELHDRHTALLYLKTAALL